MVDERQDLPEEEEEVNEGQEEVSDENKELVDDIVNDVSSQMEESYSGSEDLDIEDTADDTAIEDDPDVPVADIKKRVTRNLKALNEAIAQSPDSSDTLRRIAEGNMTAKPQTFKAKLRTEVNRDAKAEERALKRLVSPNGKLRKMVAEALAKRDITVAKKEVERAWGSVDIGGSNQTEAPKKNVDEMFGRILKGG